MSDAEPAETKPVLEVAGILDVRTSLQTNRYAIATASNTAIETTALQLVILIYAHSLATNTNLIVAYLCTNLTNWY